MTNLENIKQYALKNDGATVKNGDIIEYKKGYQVSISKDNEITGNINQLLGIINLMGLKHYGLWRDNGIWYLDTSSTHFADLKEAQEAARKADQIAIFDWSTFTSIPTK